MRTPVTEMFGIDVPILAFTHCRDVVVAVSKAGGLGVLGAVGHTIEQLEIDLDWIDEQLGGRPYGVDVIVPAVYEGSDQGGISVGELTAMIPDGHRRFLDDLLARYDVPPLDDEPTPARDLSQAAAFSAGSGGAQLAIALAHRPVLVVNALGPPPPWMVEQAKAAGAKVGALAGKPQHAQRHVNAGVDVLIAQGSEAGGHTGEIGSMVLIPEIVDAAGDVPVLGAGGIERGRQMAAAMALGAAGVWCGSVWLTTHEAETNPAVKEKMLDRDLLRHRAFQVAHRQVHPPAALGLDRRLGRARRAPAVADAAAADVGGSGAARDRPLRTPPGLGGRGAGQLLRRPDRRIDEPAHPGGPGGVRDDRRVRRCRHPPRPPARGLSTRRND